MSDEPNRELWSGRIAEIKAYVRAQLTEPVSSVGPIEVLDHFAGEKALPPQLNAKGSGSDRTPADRQVEHGELEYLVWMALPQLKADGEVLDVEKVERGAGVPKLLNEFWGSLGASQPAAQGMRAVDFPGLLVPTVRLLGIVIAPWPNNDFTPDWPQVDELCTLLVVVGRVPLVHILAQQVDELRPAQMLLLGLLPVVVRVPEWWAGRARKDFGWPVGRRVSPDGRRGPFWGDRGRYLPKVAVEGLSPLFVST